MTSMVSNGNSIHSIPIPEAHALGLGPRSKVTGQDQPGRRWGSEDKNEWFDQSCIIHLV